MRVKKEKLRVQTNYRQNYAFKQQTKCMYMYMYTHMYKLRQRVYNDTSEGYPNYTCTCM